MNFNEFKSSFTLTGYVPSDANVTTDTLGPIFTIAAQSQGAFIGGYAPTYVTSQVAPVPEPETYAMMLAGLGLLGVMARRRKTLQQ